MPEMSRSPATRWNLQDLAVSWNFMKIQWWPSECKALLKGIKHQNLYKARAHVDPLPLGLHVETWYGARSIHVEYVESLGVWTFSPPSRTCLAWGTFTKSSCRDWLRRSTSTRRRCGWRGFWRGPRGKSLLIYPSKTDQLKLKLPDFPSKVGKFCQSMLDSNMFKQSSGPAAGKHDATLLDRKTKRNEKFLSPPPAK